MPLAAILIVAFTGALFAHVLFAPPRPRPTTQAEREAVAAGSKDWMGDEA